MRRAALALLLAACAAGAAPALSPAAAQAVATFTMTPETGRPGGAFTITGSGFARCRTAFVWDDGATIASTSRASFSLRATVPASAVPGTHRVTAQSCRGNVGPRPFRVMTLAVRPASGPAGSQLELSGAGYETCSQDWHVHWDNPAADSPGRSGSVSSGRRTGLLVPLDAKAGAHRITAFCNSAATVSTTFVVTAPPTSPGAVSSGSAIPTPSGAFSMSPEGQPLPQPQPGSTVGAAAPTTPVPSPPQGFPTGAGLTFDRTSVRPGSRVTVFGSGCAPAEPVSLLVADTQLATTTVDAQGHFVAQLEIPDLEPGSYPVQAQCDRRIDGTLVVSAASSDNRGPVILLVLLAAGIAAATALVVLRRRRGTATF